MTIQQLLNDIERLTKSIRLLKHAFNDTIGQLEKLVNKMRERLEVMQ